MELVGGTENIMLEHTVFGLRAWIWWRGFGREFYTVIALLGYVDVNLGVNTVTWLPAWIMWRDFRREYCDVTSSVNTVTSWRDFKREYCDVITCLNILCSECELESGDVALGVNSILWLLAWIRRRNFRREYWDVASSMNTVTWLQAWTAALRVPWLRLDCMFHDSSLVTSWLQLQPLLWL
jgi:hypothetical protein